MPLLILSKMNRLIPISDENGYFYVVYKTTNLINGKFYIGKHKTKNINDTYLGSGKILRVAIEKYGIENFKREIICYCENLDHLDETEKVFITKELRQCDECYNIQAGGSGGDRHVYKNISPLDVALKAAETLKANPEKLATRNRKIGVKMRERYLKDPKSFIGGISNKGKKKETDIGIQRHVETIKNKTIQRHAEWKKIISEELIAGFNPKEIESKHKISLSSVYRTIALIKGDYNATTAY